MTQPIRPWRNRWIVILIASLSAVPFLLAWFYAENPQLLTRSGNYGNLIHPAQPLDYPALIGGPNAADAKLQQIKGRWVLLQVLPAGACQEACRTSLHATKQLRLMLNKDIPRVRRLLLSHEEKRGAPERDPGQDVDLLQGILSPALLARLTSAIGRAPEEGTVILLDPFANAMMWYAPGFDPYGVLKDLKQLLRTSQIG